MDNDSKFWIIINAIVFSTICAVTWISTNYWKDHNTKIVELIRDEGINPVAAMCAMQDDYSNNPVCVVLATKSE